MSKEEVIEVQGDTVVVPEGIEPCPFCKNDSAVAVVPGVKPFGFCTVCGACGPEGSDVEEATMLWNACRQHGRVQLKSVPFGEHGGREVVGLECSVCGNEEVEEWDKYCSKCGCVLDEASAVDAPDEV